MREDPSMEVRKMAEQAPDGKSDATGRLCVCVCACARARACGQGSGQV